MAGQAPDVTSIVGTAWGIASDIVGWFQYAEQRQKTNSLNAVGIYLDGNFYRDKAHALIWRMDAARNIALLTKILGPKLEAWKAGGSPVPNYQLAGWPVGSPGTAPGIEACRLLRTIRWLKSMGPLGLGSIMPSYAGLVDPGGETAAMYVTDEGYYAAQGRLIAVPLRSTRDVPLIPTWAAAAGAIGAGLAFGPGGLMLGAAGAVGSQLARTRSSTNMTVGEFLRMTDDGLDILQFHQEFWDRMIMLADKAKPRMGDLYQYMIRVGRGQDDAGFVGTFWTDRDPGRWIRLADQLAKERRAVVKRVSERELLVGKGSATSGPSAGGIAGKF